MGSCGMSCMKRDGEGKSHLPGGSSSGFKRVQADSASISVFLEYARALTKDKKFKEALSVISLCAQMTSLSTDEIQEFGRELIDFYSVHIGKGTFNTDPMDEESNIKLSILVCELTDKYWEKEKQAVQLRNEGNKLFQRGDVEGSLLKYSEAFELSKEDHLITSNRSHAFFKAGKVEEALEDAERTISLKPDWGKG